MHYTRAARSTQSPAPRRHNGGHRHPMPGSPRLFFTYLFLFLNSISLTKNQHSPLTNAHRAGKGRGVADIHLKWILRACILQLPKLGAAPRREVELLRHSGSAWQQSMAEMWATVEEELRSSTEAKAGIPRCRDIVLQVNMLHCNC